jgi:opacity protein-like surface antigen
MVVFACLAGTSVAWGQRFSLGVEAGASLTEPTRANADESRRYVVGGTVEYQLWRGFAVEGDFLYRHSGYSTLFFYAPDASNTLITVYNRTRLDVFELPVLGKYYFRRNAKLSPFVLTGYSFRKILEDLDSQVVTDNNAKISIQRFNSSGWGSPDIGASVGAGLRWRAGCVSILPQIRYTRWGGEPASGSSRNQVDLLVGITF